MVIGPAGVLAGRLRSLLAQDGVDVAWHRHAGGLLREPVADLILLDGSDLLDATAAVRRATAATLLVKTDGEAMAATCLAMGADLWLPAGTGVTLVAAQIRAALAHRGQDRHSDVLQAGGLRIEVLARRARRGTVELELTPREFDLLRVLIENLGLALSRDRILAGAWGTRFVGEPKTVDVHVAWLRPKLEGSGLRITTLRGVGYRLDELEPRPGPEERPSAFLRELEAAPGVSRS